MDKLDNFSNAFHDLKSVDFEMASENVVYRAGIIGLFSLTFELAWKALQAVLRLHGVADAGTGSPREILQLGYKVGFLHDADVWLTMLKNQNIIIHVYNEEKADELILMIKDSFIPAFEKLERTLREKLGSE